MRVGAGGLPLGHIKRPNPLYSAFYNFIERNVNNPVLAKMKIIKSWMFYGVGFIEK